MAGGELQGSCALENADSGAEIQCALIGLVVVKVRGGITRAWRPKWPVSFEAVGVLSGLPRHFTIGRWSRGRLVVSELGG